MSRCASPRDNKASNSRFSRSLSRSQTRSRSRSRSRPSIRCSNVCSSCSSSSSRPFCSPPSQHSSPLLSKFCSTRSTLCCGPGQNTILGIYFQLSTFLLLKLSLCIVGHTQCLAPVSLTGLISLVLSILCAALNLVRGAHVVEHATQVGLWTWISLVTEISRWFVRCELTRSVRMPCYLLLFYIIRLKLAVSGVASIAICLGNLYLLGHRNIWQLLFHTAVAFLSTAQTYFRPTQHSIPLPCV
uniref:Vesicle-trafficking protein SEC22a/c C-terminal domain-containing protein n=1 Tax=Eptatretus burgeri TaxID=7764 RepID=A0A8C4X1I4_EPTBU